MVEQMEQEDRITSFFQADHSGWCVKRILVGGGEGGTKRKKREIRRVLNTGNEGQSEERQAATKGPCPKRKPPLKRFYTMLKGVLCPFLGD